MGGVLNVVIGAFVATTMQVAAQDKDSSVATEIERVQKYTQKVKKFFREADEDKSGNLSWTEFKEHLQNPKVKAYFQALELDVSQAHMLFGLLDTDNDGFVTVDEFVDGATRLKGYARKIDVNMLTLICEDMYKLMRGFMKRNQA